MLLRIKFGKILFSFCSESLFRKKKKKALDEICRKTVCLRYCSEVEERPEVSAHTGTQETLNTSLSRREAGRGPR